MLEVVVICIHGRWSTLRPMSEHGFGRKLQHVMRLCPTEATAPRSIGRKNIVEDGINTIYCVYDRFKYGKSN